MRTTYYRRRRFFIAPLILIALVAFSALAMVLWNALMPVIFHLPLINFWQAAGLLILARLLFGGFGPHRHHGSWYGYSRRQKIRDKISAMSPEERKDFFKKMHAYRHGRYEDFFDKKESGKEDAKSE